MSELKTVLVDMDGVLADFDAGVIQHIQEQHPDILIPASRSNFYISDDYTEHKELVLAISNEPGFFDTLPLVEAALEGWQRIIDSGYRPRVCSSPLTANPTCKPDKLRWLEKHFVPVFGAYVVDTAIITKDKHLHDGVALIDDRPVLRKADEAAWEHVVFDRPYNKESRGLRLNGWLDALLPEILAKAASKQSQ